MRDRDRIMGVKCGCRISKVQSKDFRYRDKNRRIRTRLAFQLRPLGCTAIFTLSCSTRKVSIKRPLCLQSQRPSLLACIWQRHVPVCDSVQTCIPPRFESQCRRRRIEMPAHKLPWRPLKRRERKLELLRPCPDRQRVPRPLLCTGGSDGFQSHKWRRSPWRRRIGRKTLPLL